MPTTDNLKEAKADPPTEKSPPSVFVNSEPIREDQVQNAVKFLSHPKVRGSPVMFMYRRSFLDKKGLTREEIDEAFRRVPVSLFLFSEYQIFKFSDHQTEILWVCQFISTRATKDDFLNAI